MLRTHRRAACAASVLLALPAAAAPARKAARTLGAPRVCRNLTIVPVYDAAARRSGGYITLDEGLRAGVVTVQETGTVNVLEITNRGDRPLYLLAGEVVLGGRQDRCLGRDTIIPPGRKHVPVPVFCVEHGRWTGRAEFGETAMTVASADIRSSAQEGAFAADSARAARPRVAGRDAGAQTAEPAAALPAMSAAQQRVWDKVAAKNARFGAAPSTGTYRAVLNLSAGEAHRSITPYIKALKDLPARHRKMVGAVVAVNGKPVAADIFGDPILFRKLWPKLLRSYAADAAEHAGRKATPAFTAAQGKAFLAEAADARARTTNRSDVSSTVRLETRGTLMYQMSPAGGAMGGRALHENVLRK